MKTTRKIALWTMAAALTMLLTVGVTSAEEGGGADASHSHTAEWSVSRESTCTEPGERQRVCAVCGSVERETIPAQGHDLMREYVEPTCTATGKITLTCSRCAYRETTTLPPLGHDWASQRVEPTCTRSGSVTAKCSRCQETRVTPLAALGHNYVETEHVEPTCLETGKVVSTCTRCTTAKTLTLPALGHDIKTQRIEPTTTKAGSIIYTCSRCDYHAETVLAALTDGRSYGGGTTPAPTEPGAPSQTAQPVAPVRQTTQPAQVEPDRDATPADSPSDDTSVEIVPPAPQQPVIADDSAADNPYSAAADRQQRQRTIRRVAAVTALTTGYTATIVWGVLLLLPWFRFFAWVRRKKKEAIEKGRDDIR